MLSARIAAIVAISAAVYLAGCGPTMYKPPKPDPAKSPEYAEAVDRLAALDRKAGDLFRSGHAQEAAAAITEGQPYQTFLLAAPRPTLPAMEAASDLDDLYARMMLAGHRDGWARMLYQNNLARWRTWKPPSPASAERLRQAEAGIAECDRRLKQAPAK